MVVVARGLTVDDVLEMEDVGRAMFGPSGRTVIYERIPPYANAPNIPAILDNGDRSALAHVHALALVGVSSGDRPAFRQATEEGYWLGPRSPSGTRVAVFNLRRGTLRAGVLDLVNGHATWFSFSPNYYWYQHAPIWISNDELVYAALSPGRIPSFVYRPGLVARANELWRRAFDGEEPSATVQESAVDGIPRGQPPRQGTLVRAHVVTGRTETVASGYFYDLVLSPDGRFLAGLQESTPVQPQPDVPYAGAADPVLRELRVFELNAGGSALRPCDTCHVALGTIEWSADGAELLFFATRNGDSLDTGQWQRYRLATRSLIPTSASSLQFGCRSSLPRINRAHRVGVHTILFARSQTDPERAAQFSASDCLRYADKQPRNDWIAISDAGARINLTSSFAAVSDEIIGLTADALLVIADGDVWRLNPDGAPRNLTEAIDEPLSVWRDPTGRQRYDRAYFGTRPARDVVVLETNQSIIVLDVVSGQYNRLPKPAMDSDLLALADTGDRGVFRTIRNGTLSLSVQGQNGNREILRLNGSLASVQSGHTTELDYQYQGRQLTACALLPPDWSPARRYPTVVFVYPGIPGSCWFNEFGQFSPYTNHLLAARGYVVLYPNAARDLIRTAEGPTTGLSAAVNAAVDAAVQAGFADGDRLGIYGLSQGHHSALEVISDSARFRAAVIGYGISNFISQYGAMPLHHRLSGDGVSAGDWSRFEAQASENYLGAKPWEDPSRYVRNSPIFSVDRITTPVLLIHSDFDQFPFGQSEELFSALYRLRKPATYVTYWGEGHFNRSPANIRDYWRRVFGWFDTYLAAPR